MAEVVPLNQERRKMGRMMMRKEEVSSLGRDCGYYLKPVLLHSEGAGLAAMQIQDETHTNLLALRRTIYLTIMSR